MNNIVGYLFVASLLFCSDAFSQIPVELMAGNKRSSLDLMFFRYFKNAQGKQEKFLFFSRTRTVVDYTITSNKNLPVFGLTEAISYQHAGLKGFAPVGVVQVFNSGLFPKAGLQYVYTKTNFTFFGWMVCETLGKPNIDFFLLMRYTPILSNKMKMFSQWEGLHVLPTSQNKNYNLTQRVRLGLMFTNIQFGAALDLNYAGRKNFISNFNTGLFIRHEL